MPVNIPYENRNKFLYVDILLGKSALVTETISEEAPSGSQLYYTQYNPLQTLMTYPIGYVSPSFDEVGVLGVDCTAQFAIVHDPVIISGSPSNDGNYALAENSFGTGAAYLSGSDTIIPVTPNTQDAQSGGTVAVVQSSSRTRIIGQDLKVYTSSAKTQRIVDFEYEPLQGIFILNEDTPLSSIYVEYYRYTSRIDLPIGNVEIDMPEPQPTDDIYAQPIYFDQPIFPRSISFDAIHSDAELGKLFIQEAVLDRQFFMLIDNNQDLVLSNSVTATVLRRGLVYEGPIQSPDVLHYFRGGSLTPRVKLFVHNFGFYYPTRMYWWGNYIEAIEFRANQPL